MKTGFRDLDEILDLNDKLILVGGRPAMGKTTFVLSLAVNVALKQNIPTLIFSLESSKENLIKGILAGETYIFKDYIERNELTEEERKKLRDTNELLKQKPLYIDDTPALTIKEIRERTIKMKEQKDIKLIIIDYLQLIKLEEREDKRFYLANELKRLSKELDITIVVTSQLSRIVEKRKNKRPRITDFKESRPLVEKADIVIVLYRDDYYNLATYYKSILEVIVEKNINGILGKILLLTCFIYPKVINLPER